MNDQRKKFGDYFKIKHGYAFKSEFFSDSGNYVVVTPGNFFDEGGFKKKGDKEKFYTGAVPEGFVLKRGDLIVAMTEQAEGLLGSSALIPENNYYLHNQRLGLITDLDENKLDKKFLYYLFNFRDVRNQIRATATGAKIRHTAPERILNVRFKYLSIKVQRSIAEKLSAYDDLIENNTRRIQILEEMARRIYEEWFVRFRFPGHENVTMVESELGLIPTGWEVKKLSLLIRRLTAGNTYRDSDISSEGDVIVVDQSTSEYFGFHNNQPDHHADPEHPIIIFGDHTCKLQVMTTPFSLGANTVPLVATDETSVYYLYNLIRGLVTTQEYKRHWTELNNKTVIKASWKLCVRYDELVNPFFAAMDVFRSKNRKLRRTRDLLLPRLISGEMDVSNFPEPVSH